jgi:hypothetical protein
MTWQGMLRWENLGTGGWVLESDGRKVQLVGDVPAALNGKRVVVQGRTLEGGMGFLMAGDQMVQVSQIRET